MIYQNIKAIADSKGISIRRIELDTGITPSSIYHWDKVKPSVDKVAKVADYLGVTIEKLLSWINLERRFWMNELFDIIDICSSKSDKETIDGMVRALFDMANESTMFHNMILGAGVRLIAEAYIKERGKKWSHKMKRFYTT